MYDRRSSHGTKDRGVTEDEIRKSTSHRLLSDRAPVHSGIRDINYALACDRFYVIKETTKHTERKGVMPVMSNAVYAHQSIKYSN